MTYILIFITVVVSVLCFRDRNMFDKLSFVPYRVVHNREWYRMLSHVFVHGDYVHLAVNMFVLLSFGQNIERLFKAYAQAGSIFSSWICYLLLYFGGALAASLYDVIKRRNNPYFVSVGASGAVAAVVFASIFFNPWSKLYFFGVLPIPGIVFGVLYILYSQYMSKKSGDNINHNAHLYGALFGFLFPILMNPSFLQVFLTNLTGR